MIAFVQSARIQFLLGALISEDGCQYRVKPGCVQPQTKGTEEPSSVRGSPCLCRQPCFIQYKRPPLSPSTTGASWYALASLRGDGSSVWNARSARAVVHVWRQRGESAAGRRRAVGAGHAGIDLDFGDLAAGCVRPAPGRDEAAPAQGAETQTLGVHSRGCCRLFQ